MKHIGISIDRPLYPDLLSGCVRYLKMHALTTFLVVVCVEAAIALPSTVPVISDFYPDQRSIFTDNANTKPYFRYISFDAANSSKIYVGALDFVYRLNADNISFNSIKSENITNSADFQPMLQDSLSFCRQSQQAPDYNCRSYVRAVLPINGEIYVCATGYNKPQEFYLNDQLKVVTVVNNPDDPIGAGSGVSKCPQDPDSLFTILYVDQTSPRLLPGFYSTLPISPGDPAIYRSSLGANRTAPIQLYQIRSQSFTDPGTTFVATYEIDQFIYIFYREIAEKSLNCGRFRYSRVARVCKNDIGGNIESNKFLTFAKARIVCSISNGGDVPIYYNELYDMQYNTTERVFYGLFRISQNDAWGSAVCRFSYTDIANTFEQGQFLSQETSSSPWIITPDEVVPKPRPCMCQTNITSTLPAPTQIFGLTHYLMASAIQSMDGNPLYYNQDVGYSQFAVDFVKGLDQNYRIFILFSERRPDEIVRVVQWSAGANISSKQFSVLKPFSNDTSRLLNMVLNRSSQRNWLYFVKDTAVFQLSTVLCSQYKLCTDCVRDPYCGWDYRSIACLPFGSRTGLIQNVESPSPLTACNAVCVVNTTHPPFIPGLPVHLNCSSYCSPEGSVTWHFSRDGSSVQLFPSLNGTQMPETYILTQDGGLVILNFESSLEGTLMCKSNGVTLSAHMISATSTSDLRTTFLQEYKKWCEAFTSYKVQYNNWVCLRTCLATSTTPLTTCRESCTMIPVQ